MSKRESKLALGIFVLIILTMAQEADGFFWLTTRPPNTTRKPTTPAPVLGCDEPEAGMIMCARISSRHQDRNLYFTIMNVKCLELAQQYLRTLGYEKLVICHPNACHGNSYC